MRRRLTMTVLPAVIVASLVPAAPVRAAPSCNNDDGCWSLLTATASPVPRYAAGLAGDHGGAVLFGGIGATGDLGDTWVHVGSWVPPIDQNSPPARHGHTMATIFISAGGTSYRSQTVMFGGSSAGGYLGDTWTFGDASLPNRNGVWRRVATTGPSGREFAATTNDVAGRTWILFGGRDASGPLNDTWVWDGTNWTRKSPATSPPPRDSAWLGQATPASGGQKKIVLFGGRSGSTVLGDTWIWDGINWTQVSSGTSPAARYGASNAGREGDLLVGGASGTSPLGDQWKHDTKRWVKVSGKSPSAREYAAGEAMILFGGRSGTTLLNDTWTLRYPIPPCPDPCA